ncbi:MAG: tetratricopeptide repeat protein [Chloroflexota bacterium]
MNLEINYNSRYRLQEKLGQGGMGVVYRATDRLTGETVALKRVTQVSKQTLTASGVSEEDLHLALAYEFQILAGLRHPHIISVLDYGFGVPVGVPVGVSVAAQPEDSAEAKRQPFFTMTYLDDELNVLAAAQDKPLTVKLNLIQQILEALAYLHRRGVLHRDLKPANVLVQHGDVRLLDFGLAATSDEQGSSSAGTPPYMAPELFEGYPYSAAADLYAVGVLMTELLTGRHPFLPFDYAFLDRVLYELPNLGNIPASLEPVVQKLLAKEPGARYASASDVLLSLQMAQVSAGESAVDGIPVIDVPETEAVRESYLQAATFVGRETEMAELVDALQATEEGHGSAWLVGGESGVGKSRLLREVRTQALVSGFLVLVGQASETGSGSIYELWRQPLRHLILTLPNVTDLDAGVLLPIVPDIAQLLDRDIPPAPQLDGETAQIRLFSTIAALFKEAQQPLLLIMEDLHWAEAGLAVLPYLLHEIEQHALLVVGTYRNDERPALAQTLSGMKSIPLSRLTAQNMTQLSTAMLGDIGQRPDILQLLQRETEGNAFFAVEVIRALAEKIGGLRYIGEMSLPETLLPNGIQSIVERRLDRVPQSDQHLLQLAAVAGRNVDLRLMAWLVPDVALDRWLSACADAAVLEVVDDTWRFQHAKIRDGLLAVMPIEIRKHHHQAVAEAIETCYPNNPVYAAQLMVHWRHAGDPAKEYTYAHLAGTYAADQYANTDAITYLTKAYELIDMLEIDEQRKTEMCFETLLAREQVYSLSDQTDVQQNDLDELRKLADAFGQPTRLSEIARRQAGHAHKLGEFTDAVTYAQQAIQVAQETGVPLLVVIAQRVYVEILVNQGAFDDARTIVTAALQTAQEIDAHEEVAHLVHALGGIAKGQNHNEQAFKHLTQSLHMYQSMDNMQGTAATLQRLGELARDTAQQVDAMTYAEQSLALFQKIGDRRGESRAFNDMGTIYSLYNQSAAAKLYYEKALAIYERIGDKEGIGDIHMNLGVEACLHGQLDEGYQNFTTCLNMYQEIGSTHGQLVAHLNLGFTLRPRVGVYTQALYHFEQSLRLGQEVGSPVLEADNLMNVGQIMTFVGQYDHAHPFLASAVDLHRQFGTPFDLCNALDRMGNYLIAQGAYQDARVSFAEALTLHPPKKNDESTVFAVQNKLGWIAYHLDDYETMAHTYQMAFDEFIEYQEIEDTQQEPDNYPREYYPHEYYESLMGVVWGQVLRSVEVSLLDIEPCLDYLATLQPQIDSASPLRLHLMCHDVLLALDDNRADDVLAIAHQHLQTHAGYIENPEWRQSFLENVPENREILRRVEELKVES